LEEVVNSDVAKELLVVLSYCDNEFIKRIPNEVLIKINDMAADSNKSFYIDESKNLEEQSLSWECRELLSELYFRYMLSSDSKNKLVSEIINSLDNL